jgi:DNA-binding CsgD family transcriptional regulator/N-acetylneuraminic acid mutarotase
MDQANGELSERELEIVRLLATGASNQQIARALVISPNTVKVHLRNVFAKLGVESRTEATLRAIQQGWVTVPTPEAGAETTAAADAPPLREPVRPPLLVRPRATTAQRVLMIVALVAALVGALVAPGREHPSASAPNPFLDQGPSQAAAAESGTSRWSVRAPLPTPRGRLAVAAVGDRLYAIGGVSRGRVVPTVEEYRSDGNSWSTRAAKPLAVANVGAAVVNGRIYVPGGYSSDGQVVSTVEVYDPAADVWSGAARMPQPLCAYAIAVVGERLYVLGGWNGREYMRTTWHYDPSADSWQEGPALPQARGFAAAAVVDGKIYLIGGFDGAELSLVQELDPGTGQWTDRTPLSAPRAGISAVSVGASIYVLGGGWSSYLAFSERYEPRSNTWSRFETPILGQWRNLGAAAVADKVYAVGGWSNEDLDANREYQTVFRIAIPR